MIIWMPILFAAFVLLTANAFGWIDLNSRPLTRVCKWLLVALWAWFLPLVIKKVFKIEFDPAHLELWKMLVIGFLLAWITAALLIWVWRHYGPAPEGCARCKHCRAAILKVMLECPHCKKQTHFHP